MMAVITMLVLGTVFALLFHLLLKLWTSMQTGWRVGAHLVLSISFLVIYLAYSLGYLAMFGALAQRWPGLADFGTWTDDVAAVVPFVIAIVMFWRMRATTRSSRRAPSSPGI